ncbi:MAG: GMC family oxidoreductase [Cyanobacteriota bacterium]|nr:GMC family oxidoreductase [Cyanobacteriota bacterium]
MLVDARRLEDGHTIQVDVCVIGGGAAGLTLALMFEERGIGACIIESGGFSPEEANRDLYRGDSLGLPYRFADGQRSRYLGGSSNCWGGWCRPMEEEDFLERDWFPYSGWPIQKSDLQPYYDRCQQLLKLGPPRYDVPFWVKEIGRPNVRRHPFVGSDVVDVITQFSPPVRFGIDYREQIESAKHVTIYLNTNVVNIATEGGEAVQRVDLKTLTGRRATVRAKIFVLATGGIENPRLLLASNGDRPAGLGNQNDLVGRFFMEHARMTTATVNFREGWADNILYDMKYNYHSQAVSALGISVAGQFGLSAQTRAREGLLNTSVRLDSVFMGEDTGVKDALVTIKRRLAGGDRPSQSLRQSLTTLATQPLQTAGFLVSRRLRPRALIQSTRFQVISEPTPDPSSRVTLSSRRDQLGMNRVGVDWRVGAHTKRSIDRTVALVAEEFHRAGVADVTLDPPFEVHGWPASFEEEGCWHHMGTTRMHHSPRLGVVDKDCRVHDTTNLFVAGSSVFPTAGGDFPTITIVALALRLADHIEATLASSPRLAVA